MHALNIGSDGSNDCGIEAPLPPSVCRDNADEAVNSLAFYYLRMTFLAVTTTTVIVVPFFGLTDRGFERCDSGACCFGDTFWRTSHRQTSKSWILSGLWRKDLGSELERMQGVIDDLLRERSQWMGGRHVGPVGVTEVSIPMDLGTIVDTTKQEAKDLVWRGVEFCGPSSSRR